MNQYALTDMILNYIPNHISKKIKRNNGRTEVLLSKGRRKVTVFIDNENVSIKYKRKIDKYSLFDIDKIVKRFKYLFEF